MTKQYLIDYTLQLADNALILAQRNSEWCGHGPVLEQDIAISNISLDLIGQARNFYQYAATLIGGNATEDSLAYLRDAIDFKNNLISEILNGDWAQTVLRQFLVSTYQFYLYDALQKSPDQQLAAIAEKALKEVTYHVRWSSEWVIRLGDGTSESKQRIEKALEEIWPYTGELFIPVQHETDAVTAGIGVDPKMIEENWKQKVSTVFSEATLTLPPQNIWMHTGGKNGIHTEYLGYILAEMQFMQRAYPSAEW